MKSQPVYKVFLNQEEPNPNQEFTDTLFPPNESSLSGQIEENSKKFDISNIEWKRASEIFPKPFLFENTITIEDVKQGKLNIGYLLSSIAALCEYPGLIRKIFITEEYNKNGIYKLLLFIDGEYQVVYLDDYFPCIKGTHIPYFSKPNSYEMWVLLLEKAWAKINGGYANILNGWPSEVFRVLTGFGCESLNFKAEPNEERIWRLLSTVNESNGVICVSTRDAEEVGNAGLNKGFTYTLIDTLLLEDDRKNPVYLCKLYDPWKNTKWTGDWSEGSEQWTDSIKKQVGKEKEKSKDSNIPPGVFYLCLKDLLRYFFKADLCQIIYDGYSKTFEFGQGELSQPQIFNFFLLRQGNVSITVTEKKWRYHKELIGVNHPTSLVLAEYDPRLKLIKYVCCDYESLDDVEKCRKLNPGFYILWVFKNLPECEKPLPDSMRVKIISESKLCVKHLGPDKDFDAIRQIIYQGVRLQKKNEIKNDEIFYDIGNDFKRSGLAYRLIINPLANAYQKWELDATDVKGYSLLPPYAKQEKFSLTVGPCNFGVILAMKNQNYGKFCFKLKSDVEQLECREGEDPSETKRIDFDTFCLNDIHLENPLINKETISLKEATKKVKYPKVNHAEIFAEKYKEISPLIKESLIKLEPLKTAKKKKLGWIVLNKDNGVYYGEGDYMTPEGRGCFIFNDTDLIWIGYFEEGAKGSYGKLYSKDGKLLYEGEYKNGLRNGKGTYYYKNGEKYEGDFVDGLREGNGVFTWDDGTKWEGTFKDNEMNGTGTFFDGDDSFPATYKDGDLVD